MTGTLYADWCDPANTPDADTLIGRVRDNEGRSMFNPQRDPVVAIATLPRAKAIAAIRVGGDVTAIVAAPWAPS
jgi:hypothetical protein